MFSPSSPKRTNPPSPLRKPVAAQFDAQLSATFLAALPDEPLAYEPTVVAGVWAELLGRARKDAESARQKVQERLSKSARPCELQTAEALSRDLGRVAAVHARYADISVLSRPLEGAGCRFARRDCRGRDVSFRASRLDRAAGLERAKRGAQHHRGLGREP